MQFSTLILMSLLPLGLALPTPTKPTSSPVPSNRVTKFPVCGTLGFTEEPGDNEMGPLEGQKLTLKECVNKCRNNGTCKAVSYAQVYELCSFYSKPMNHDKLDKDDTSNFSHFDNFCYV